LATLTASVDAAPVDGSIGEQAHPADFLILGQ
jgi:hypothetical protein